MPDKSGTLSVDQALLLAAGLGRRTQHLTADTAKPLLRLGGRALIDHALDRLGEDGVTQVAVNAHYMADQLAAHLAYRPGPPTTILRRETELLDTGGAVAAALADGVMGQGPFYVVNTDSVWLDGPAPTLMRLRRALRRDVDGVILVHRCFQVRADVGLGDFQIDTWGYPRRRRAQEIVPYVYAGVTLARPALFAGLPQAVFSMNAVWDRAIAGRRLVALVHDGLWFHLTSPGDLEEAENALAAQLTGSTT